MSLLWRTAAVHQRQGMAWDNHNGDYHPQVHHVRDVGFAGHVDFHPRTLAQEFGGRPEGLKDPWDDRDEDLHEDTAPEPTPEEQAHYDRHGYHSDAYMDRHDEAYEKAFNDREAKARPDHYDDRVMRFIRNFGADTSHWNEHGTFGPISLKQPVYATQSHVSQTHLDKYHDNPGAQSARFDKMDPEMHQHLPEHHGDKAPMFVTHQGRLHTIEGHHRVGAALQRGDETIDGWHFNADEKGFPPNPEETDEHREFWKSRGH